MFSSLRLVRRAPVLSVLVLLFAFAPTGSAGVLSFSGSLDPANWTIEDIGLGGGFVDTSGAPVSVTVIGGDDGIFPDNMFESTMLFWTTITFTDVLTFDWLYMTSDFSPSMDIGGYYLNGALLEFDGFDPAGASVQSGAASIQVTDGDLFGFYVWSLDSTGGSGILRITGAEAPPPPPGGGVPEPSTALLVVAGSALLLARRLWRP